MCENATILRMEARLTGLVGWIAKILIAIVPAIDRPRRIDHRIRHTLAWRSIRVRVNDRMLRDDEFVVVDDRVMSIEPVVRLTDVLTIDYVLAEEEKRP